METWPENEQQRRKGDTCYGSLGLLEKRRPLATHSETYKKGDTVDIRDVARLSPSSARLRPPSDRCSRSRDRVAALGPPGQPAVTPGDANAKQCADSSARCGLSTRLNLLSSDGAFSLNPSFSILAPVLGRLQRVNPEDRGAPAPRRLGGERVERGAAAPAQETWEKLVTSAGRRPRGAPRGRGRGCSAEEAAPPSTPGALWSLGAPGGAWSERGQHGRGDRPTSRLGEPGEFPLRPGDPKVAQASFSLLPHPSSAKAREEDLKGRCWRDSAPEKTPADRGVPISTPCPEPRRPAGAAVFVFISIAELCVPVARPDPPPPPPSSSFEATSSPPPPPSASVK
uniref:formin-like protein 4 n=1 Tax=Ictidomys tridecemlineatus TaxID=43179 RepID=UPI001A9D974B|nr:formin-like protein 4 [Ictidomys tridecemlineatus]